MSAGDMRSVSRQLTDAVTFPKSFYDHTRGTEHIRMFKYSKNFSFLTKKFQFFSHTKQALPKNKDQWHFAFHCKKKKNPIKILSNYSNFYLSKIKSTFIPFSAISLLANIHHKNSRVPFGISD